MAIIYLENHLTAENFIAFQQKMGWQQDPKVQLEKALANSRVTIAAMQGDELVGMGRLVGDGAMYWYLQDIFVLNDYQGQGIGSEIVNQLIAHVKAATLPGTGVFLGLMAAKEKERFYKQFGFVPYPNDKTGAGMGMELWL